MDPYGDVWNRKCIFFVVVFGVPDLVRTVSSSNQSAAPDRPADISNNQGVCLLPWVQLFRSKLGSSDSAGLFFAEVSLVFLHSDAAEEPESSRNRNDTGFSCFCSFALTGNSWK